LITILLAGTALALNGCKQPRQICDPDPIHPLQQICTSSVISHPLDAGTHKSGAEIVSMTVLSQWKISTTGSTVGIPANGLYSITLKGMNGAILDQASFPWVRNGQIIIPENLAVVGKLAIIASTADL